MEKIHAKNKFLRVIFIDINIIDIFFIEIYEIIQNNLQYILQYILIYFAIL